MCNAKRSHTLQKPDSVILSIHTLPTVNPIPTFVGEPERIEIPDCIDCFTNEIWDNLDENNKISLYVRMTDLTTGEIEERLINKHTHLR